MRETLVSFSPSPEAVTHKLYYEEAPLVPDYESAYVLVRDPSMVRLSVELPIDKKEVVLNIAASAVDKGGNESDLVYAHRVKVEICCSRCPQRYSRYPILARLICELMHVFGGCEHEDDKR